MSMLEEIDLSENNFHGAIPWQLGHLSNLIMLSLGSNHLMGETPLSIGNMSMLEEIYSSQNNFHGAIPWQLGHLSNLIMLSLESNNLMGEIPWSLFNVTRLRQFSLTNYSLSGNLPSSFGLWLPNLDILYLGYNQISGIIPNSISNVSQLVEIDLSSNLLLKTLIIQDNPLNGILPKSIGNFSSSLEDFIASACQIKGIIPREIGNLINLVQLGLGFNDLTGSIPVTFGQLLKLQVLEIAIYRGTVFLLQSQVIGETFVNVSFNRLSGEIPNGGPFSNFTYESFMQNDGLCGAPQFHVRKCASPQKSQKTEILLKYIVPPIASSVIVVGFLVGLLRCKKKSRQLPIQCDLPLGVTHRRISHQEILYSTNYFSEVNLIGKGGIGSVYKGIFTDGMVAAVKVFNLEQQGAFQSFDAECEVMRNIRHRNLVKIISSCSNLDFIALVLEYMPNGNLDRWLYSHNYCLTIVQRLCIMIDVASAVKYLHHGSSTSTPVVHCDLKPSNILLDEDRVAHVGDFGIAKLLMENNSMGQTKTLGTIGYMAPEYGSAGIVSAMADVYSYGILLMETFTRKKPTDDLFLGELSLKHWVCESFPSEMLEVVDANLLRGEEENFASTKNCLSSLLELALECTTDLPEERVNMKNVLARLKKIKITFHENVRT
ncbi:probable LRR receptor-like serine/threonine-protein kinase At3g47570 [Cornus florida]|uniref:probable LRR receptor-like serine/threonine-protein kinase At3g47570 n=1 Tax=Cornus florida TaxID=4283 RepID=UPI00289915DB|nr:probable LRR receptor-like serine/threonine-protein kinase At3g47570 [Cornus florida]